MSLKPVTQVHGRRRRNIKERQTLSALKQYIIHDLVCTTMSDDCMGISFSHLLPIPPSLLLPLRFPMMIREDI